MLKDAGMLYSHILEPPTDMQLGIDGLLQLLEGKPNLILHLAVSFSCGRRKKDRIKA